jgi:tungstate transport system substrate-binding protein
MRSGISPRLLAALACAALPAAAGAGGLDIRMATTTSTDNSGLLQDLLPKYEVKCRCKVRYMAVGTGNAIKLGENGDVDLIMVHARAAEDRFVAEGHGVNRRDLMYNDFVIVGPHGDPAGIRGERNLGAALKKIQSSDSVFVSRGDDSGTHKKELELWKEAGLDPKGPRYLSIGQGMGQTLMVSAEKQGYTLADRATFATYKDKTGLEIMVEGAKNLLNPYGVIAVNPKRYPGVNYPGAMAFIDWLTSGAGQEAIASFRPNGAQLFFPAAAR